MGRLSYGEVYKIFNENGYELLEKEYKNVSSGMKCIDMYGYMYNGKIATLKAGSKFDKFNIKNPYSIYNMNMYLKINKKNSVLISDEYLGNKKKYLFKCECGKEYESLFSSVFMGEKDSCDQCSREIAIKKCKHDISYVKDVFSKKGYTLLENKYVKNNSKMTCIDKNGYLYYASLRMVSSHDKLSAFGNGNIYTLKNLQKYLELNGSCTKVLSDSYLYYNENLKFKCGVCGDVYETTLSSTTQKGKHSCNKCSMNVAKLKMRLSYDEVVNWTNQNTDCTLLSIDYEGNNKPLMFECKCGKEFTTTFAGLKNGKQQCDDCGKNNQIEKRTENIEDVKQYFINKGYTPVFTEYYGCEKNKLSAINPSGYMVECWLSDFKSGKEPEVFHASNKYTLENIDRFCKLETHGEYRCLEGSYVNNSSEMKFIHNSCGTEFKVKWVNFQGRNTNSGIKQVGTRCPYCQSQRIESTHATVLKQIFLKLKSDGTVLEDPSCINPETGYPLYTDIVNHKEKIAIEIQSSYHDNDNQIKKDNFKKQFWIKRGYCFYDPDIREYTVLEMIRLFFPKMKHVPQWINYNFSDKLNTIQAQKLLDEGMSVSEVCKIMNVKKERVSGAIFNKRLVLPIDYKRMQFNVNPIVKLNFDGKFLAKYNSAQEAKRIDADAKTANSVIKCANKNIDNFDGIYNGYIWMYEYVYESNAYVLPIKKYNNYETNVVQLSLTGDFINEYADIYEAEKETNINRTYIKDNVVGRRDSGGGFIWVSLHNYNNKNYKIPKTNILNTKKVLRINPNNILEYKLYKNTKEIALEFNVNNCDVRGWIKDNYIRKGFVWVYEDENVEDRYNSKTVNGNSEDKPILMLDKDNNVVKEFKNRRDIINGKYISKHALQKCLSGKQKLANGYVWMYKDDYKL